MRLIKKLILFLFVLLLLGGAIAVGIAHVYQDEIEQLQYKTSMKTLTPIKVEDIEFSLSKSSLMLV